MNIIFSEENDVSTNYLIDWFIFFKVKYLRYNGLRDTNQLNNAPPQFDNLFPQDFIMHINNKQGKCLFIKGEKVSDITSIYFRRPYNGDKDYYQEYTENLDQDLINYINSKIRKYSIILKQSIVDDLLINTKNILGRYDKTNLNKVITLKKAMDSGLNIPATIITGSYSDVVKFYNAHNQKIICKSIEEIIYFHSKLSDKTYSTKTILIDSISKIKKNNFSISLFQEYIEKEFEIRVFYMNKQFFSCAIFSQQNIKTRVDFRNYDDRNPNKMVPYIIEDSIQSSIINLMESLNINIGSIDLIKALDGKYYFLEVNPVGQYDFVSKCCGYNLDYIIAKYLINEK